jgi:hypothetical protein
VRARKLQLQREVARTDRQVRILAHDVAELRAKPTEGCDLAYATVCEPCPSAAELDGHRARVQAHVAALRAQLLHA